MTDAAATSGVTCLGCGLLCDDLAVSVAGGRITGVAPECTLARAWFGDGTVPAEVRVAGRPATDDAALEAATELLAGARGRLLAWLGPDLVTGAHRAVVELADRLHAVVDTATSPAAAAGILAGQRRGRAASTLGELRNRADLLLCWGTDPSARYPRLLSRYALEPEGTHVGGRAARTLVGVRVGADAGPAGADLSLALGADEELAALAVLRSAVLGQAPAELPAALVPFRELGARLLAARYVGILVDGEGGDAARRPQRAEALIALAQALQHATRATLVVLRAGGNRTGAESLLGWQTGYPFAVDFGGGHPAYLPDDRGLERLGTPRVAAALVAGDWRALPDAAVAALHRLPTVVVGPRASTAPFGPQVALDTGVAGIHEAGNAYRLDDVPLPLTPVLAGPRGAAATLEALARRVAHRLAEA